MTSWAYPAVGYTVTVLFWVGYLLWSGRRQKDRP
jgi:hypothetical protein